MKNRRGKLGRRQRVRTKISARLGRRIAQRRTALKMSVRELADRIGLDASVQRRVESGSVGVTVERLVVYSRILGVRPAQLLTGALS